MTIVIGSIEQGHYVLRAPEWGQSVAVPLRPIGQRIGGVEIGAVCARLGDPQVSGKLWNKLKKGAKKAVQKTVQVAKKVASNKLTKKLYNAAKSVTPAPFSLAFTAAEAGAKIVKAVKSGNPKAKKAASIAKKLAEGKVSLPKAKAAAKAAGIKDPNIVRDAALMPALKAAAAKNPKLAATLAQAGEIDRGVNGATKVVTAKSGRKYEVTVRAA